MFVDSAAAAGLLRIVRWHGGVFYPNCKKNVAKHRLCQKHLQRYTCKDCVFGRAERPSRGNVVE